MGGFSSFTALTPFLCGDGIGYGLDAGGSIKTLLWLIGGFIILFGTAYGTVTLARVMAVAHQFGASHYGRISRVMVIFLTIGSTIAPVGVSLIYDQFNILRLFYGTLLC